MSAITLTQSLDEIQQFCRKHGIALVYADMFSVEDVNVLPAPQTQEPLLAQMLSLAQQAGVRLLNVSLEENDLVIEEEALQEWLAELDDEEDREIVLTDVALVQKHYGELVRLTLSFYYQGGLYSCEQTADWKDAYDMVFDALYGEISDDEDVDFDEDEDEKTDLTEGEDATEIEIASGGQSPISGAERLGGVKNGPFMPSLALLGERNALSEDTIEKEARQLIENEQYLRAKTKTERSVIASEVLQQGGFAFSRDRWAIQDRVEELYQNEVVLRLEGAIIEKIRTYLTSHKNPTMAGAARLLGIDVRTVGRYWQKAKG